MVVVRGADDGHVVEGGVGGVGHAGHGRFDYGSLGLGGGGMGAFVGHGDVWRNLLIVFGSGKFVVEEVENIMVDVGIS